MPGKYTCRCRHCRQRKSLARMPDDYMRGHQPKCPCCGARNWRYEWRRPSDNCACTAYHFVHRKGSGRCMENVVFQAQRARDEGAEAEDVLDILVSGEGRRVQSDKCPF